MSFIYLHGMGGNPADWSSVQKILPGKCLALPDRKSFQELIPFLADEIAGEPNPILCGYSMGGRVALLLAEELLRRRLPLGGLALLASGLGFSAEGERGERRQIDEKWAAMAEETPEIFWRKWYAQPLFQSFSRLAPEIQKGWLDSRKSMNISNLIYQLGSLGPSAHPHLLPILAQLREASISVLYLAGELDKKYLDLGQMLAKQEGAALGIIPDAGHILPLEAPQQIAERLRNFFPNAQ